MGAYENKGTLKCLNIDSPIVGSPDNQDPKKVPRNSETPISECWASSCDSLFGAPRWSYTWQVLRGSVFGGVPILIRRSSTHI